MNRDEAVADLVTIRDFIRWGASRFNEAALTFGHGTDNALDEAAVLVLHAVALDASLPPHYLDARLTRSEREAVVRLIERRIVERRPAPYLTGTAWFAGLPFRVDERVLVPRSPMAELIEHGFEPWMRPEDVHDVLDLCTGSGCLAIAMAHAFPEAAVTATDVSADALAVANINRREHGLEDRLELIRSDLFEALGGRRFDLIVSNPPYVSAQEMADLPPEYRHEPALGLAAGEAGLDIVLRLLRDAADHLNPDGLLIVEVGDSAEALARCLPTVPFTWLDFERGGHGVFLLTAETCTVHRDAFHAVSAARNAGTNDVGKTR